MFPWEGKELAEIDALMAARDPRRYRLALVTDTADGDATVMVWFSGRSEMGHYLARVEPRRRGLDGLDYIRLRDALQETLAGLEIRGTSNDLREAVNLCADPLFRIRWWGTLESLRQGDTSWAREQLAALQPAATPPLHARRTSELLQHLQRYAPRDPA
ncbi:hypothetical protein [Aquisalimonas asiatica]|uniref:Uncharacterized protein n=1 Tax=Aquisalimonas asiatica TaxID=406100 RepID=A0A1H8QPX4_9GAMM|nr:hypothetical protein [Aquisalimonas asiatica]SEO56270.1 hypothetical protein SAMN04488052_101712 [Aquisalimonas asiatica]